MAFRKILIYVFFQLFCSFSVLQGSEVDTNIQLRTAEISAKLEFENFLKVRKSDSISRILFMNENMAEWLQKSSFLHFNTLGYSNLASINFRGTGASGTKVLWNGLPINNGLVGQFDFAGIPSFFIDDFQFSTGAATFQKTSGALGAVFDLQSFAAGNKPKVLLNSSIGSFGAKSVGLSLHFNKKNFLSATKLFYREAANDFHFTNIAAPNFPREKNEHAANKQFGVQYDFVSQLKHQFLLSGAMHVVKTERQLPKLITAKLAAETQDDLSFRSFLKLRKDFQKLKSFVSLGFTFDDLRYENPLAGIYSKGLFYNSIFRGQIVYHFSEKTQLGFANLSQFQQAENFGFTQSVQRLMYENSLFFTHQLSKNFSIHANVQQVGDFDSLLVFNQSLSLNFDAFENKLALKLSAGSNSNIPSLNDLYWMPGGNPNLLAERSKSLNIDARVVILEKRNHRVIFENSSFAQNINDKILWQPAEGAIWTAQNLQEVEILGNEMELNYDFKSNKKSGTLGAAWAFTDAVDAKNNVELIYVPRHVFTVQARGSWNDKFVFYQFKSTARRFISSENDLWLPNFQLHQIGFGANLYDGKKVKLMANFSVNNLLNTNYMLMAWRPMPGRNYSLNIQMQLW